MVASVHYFVHEHQFIALTAKIKKYLQYASTNILTHSVKVIYDQSKFVCPRYLL